MNLVLEQIKERFNIRIDFPVDKFASAVGVLLVLTVEQSVLWFKERGTISSDPEQPKETDALLSIGVADSDSTYGTTEVSSPVDKYNNHTFLTTNIFFCRCLIRLTCWSITMRRTMTTLPCLSIQVCIVLCAALCSISSSIFIPYEDFIHFISLHQLSGHWCSF